MNFRQRSAILGLLASLAAGAYFALVRYSPRLITGIVEETLVIKAPVEMDAGLVRKRFRLYVESQADEKSRLECLLGLSQTLEKIQKLNGPEFEALVKVRSKIKDR